TRASAPPSHGLFVPPIRSQRPAFLGAFFGALRRAENLFLDAFCGELLPFGVHGTKRTKSHAGQTLENGKSGSIRSLQRAPGCLIPNFATEMVGGHRRFRTQTST